MIALLAPVALQVAAPVFAPPLDQALPYSVREVRQDGERTQRFTIERRVTFRRTPDGYAAEVDTVSVAGDAGRAGRLFEAMTRALLGTRVLIRLDADGRVVEVDDLDRIWNAQLASIPRAFGDREPARTALLDALLAPLQTLDRPARIARVGQMISSLISDRTLSVSPTRAITLSARRLDGRTMMLAGTERVVAMPDRLLSLEREASGVADGTSMSVAVRKRIDQARGLVLATSNVETVDAGSSRLIVTRTIALAP